MSDPGLRRIAFVTRHYSVLRHGVARAIFAPCLIAVGGVELIIESVDPGTVMRLALGLAVWATS